MVEKQLDGVVMGPDEISAEIAKLSAAVDMFAVEMKQRLFEKLKEGRTGWDNPALRNQFYVAMLAQGAASPEAVGVEADVANFAMMLWWSRTHV